MGLSAGVRRSDLVRFQTGVLALIGIRLPGIEFFNQRVEAAYRKELVIGEDDAARADPPTVQRAVR